MNRDAVQDGAVFGVPDEEFSEVRTAVVEPLPGAALDPGALRTALLPHLAGYKLPKHIEVRTGLSREDSGEIFKRRLRDRTGRGRDGGFEGIPLARLKRPRRA